MVSDEDENNEDAENIKFFESDEEVGYVNIEMSSVDYIMDDWLDADDFPEECEEWYDNSDDPVYIVHSVYTHDEFRGRGMAREMLKEALPLDQDYILNASPQYGTELSSIVKLYKDSGFETLYDQGNNVIMYRHAK
jgi:GNAT superfamily N-acetyltransferase